MKRLQYADKLRLMKKRMLEVTPKQIPQNNQIENRGSDNTQNSLDVGQLRIMRRGGMDVGQLRIMRRSDNQNHDMNRFSPNPRNRWLRCLLFNSCSVEAEKFLLHLLKILVCRNNVEKRIDNWNLIARFLCAGSSDVSKKLFKPTQCKLNVEKVQIRSTLNV